MPRTLEPPSALRLPPLPRAPAAASPLRALLPPALAILGAVTAVMATAWFLGTVFDLRVDSGFRPARVIAAAPEPSTVEALRARADGLRRRAEGVEARALAAGLDAETLEGERKRAEAYGEWAVRVEARASAREAVLATRESRRILWIYSISLDLLVCTVAALIALALVLRVLGALRGEGRVTRRFAAGVLAATAVLTAAVTAVCVAGWYDYRSDPFLLVLAALEDWVLGMVRLDDGLHMATTVIFAMAGALVVAAPRLLQADTGADGAEAAARQARQVADSMRLTRFILYVGAGMVVAYVVAVSAVFHWTLAHVDPAPAALFQGVDALTRSAVTARSLLASALLVAVYAPASFSLRVMASELAARALPGGTLPEREEWLKQQGLASASSFQHWKTLAAILAPVVTGPIADLVQGALG